MITDRQFHRIERVPRVFGPATNSVLGGGRVQFGLNVAAWPTGLRTRLRKYTPEMRDEDNISSAD